MSTYEGLECASSGTIASSGHVHKCPEKSPKSKIFDGWRVHPHPVKFVAIDGIETDKEGSVMLTDLAELSARRRITRRVANRVERQGTCISN